MPLRFAEPASEAYAFPLTVRHLLDSALTAAADQRIVYRDQASFSYREFAGRIGRLASLLERVGAEQGATIAMLDWDSHRYLEAYFAIPMMGAVLQTVNVRLPPPQVAYTLRHAKAQILIVHRDFFPLVDAILPTLPGIKAVIAIIDGGEDALPAYALGEYEALSVAASPDYPFEDFDENAVATTFYTTGTTGNPKGVCFTHRQLVLHTLACVAPLAAIGDRGFGYRDVYMPLTPMFHVHAWGVPYVATMLGAKQVYPGRYEAERICALRAEHGITLSHCVPTVLRMVLDAADRTDCDLKGWTMLIGGSALPAQLCEEGRRRGMNLVAGYGMSETAPLIAVGRIRASTTDRETEEIDALVTVVPAPMVSARIAGENMDMLPHDDRTRGELVLRAPWLTPCYTGDGQASEALWSGGWMHTQDVATIAPDGYIHIRDRLKDVIKTGGEWIDSIHLEELVATADGVAEVAVVAIPDANWGERPLAIVVPEPGIVPALETLNLPVEKAIASGAITRYAKLDRFVVIDALPRTSVGKIDKKTIRVALADGTMELALQSRRLNTS